MDSIIPMAFIHYISMAASDVKFEDPFVEFGTSMSHFNLLNKK